MTIWDDLEKDRQKLMDYLSDEKNRERFVRTAMPKHGFFVAPSTVCPGCNSTSISVREHAHTSKFYAICGECESISPSFDSPYEVMNWWKGANDGYPTVMRSRCALGVKL